MSVVNKVDKLVLDRLRLEGLAVQSDAANFLCKFLRSQENAQEVLDEIIASIPKNSLTSSHVDIDVFRVAIESISRDDSEVLKTHVLRVLTLEQYPLMEYHPARKTYLRATKPLNLHADADAKILLYRNRLASIRQRLSRKDTFSLPILQQLAGKREYFQLTSIDSLLGGAGEKTVLGLLTQIQDGKWFLEDERSYVQLDLSDALTTPGFFTENSIVIAQGDLQNDIFNVKVLGMPPAENRKDTEFSFPALDFFGEAPPSKLVPRLTEYEKQRHMIVVLSEVWLDDPAVVRHLRTLFSGFEQYVPKAFIFLGSFFSRPFGKKADDSVTYRACFDALADLIGSFKPLASQCEFIFIPGPNDPGPAVLPRMSLPRVFTAQLRARLGKRVHFAPNPCRVRYCTQELVFYRDDLLSMMRKHCVAAPTDEPSLSDQLVRTLLDQSHLSPLPLSVRPVYWSADHALSLYPLPHVLVLADRQEQFVVEYQGCHCYNPGLFSVDQRFMVYDPSTQTSEWSSLNAGADGEDEEKDG